MSTTSYLQALPCNHKLIEIFIKYPQNNTIRRQVRTELCLERQKIHIVLRFIFMNGKLKNELISIYKKRLHLIDSCMKKLDANLPKSDQHSVISRCYAHGTVKTCDFVTEAAVMLVNSNNDRKACNKWMAKSIREIKRRRCDWKRACSKKPMGKVSWKNFEDAYKRITEWAVDECLENQLSDLEAITAKIT